MNTSRQFELNSFGKRSKKVYILNKYALPHHYTEQSYFYNQGVASLVIS